mgnify:CR=1 FL=1
MGQISLQIMTRELCHDLYKGWTNDASIYMDMKLFKPYTYNEDAVNRYFESKQDVSRVVFAIMLDAEVIGELQLKQIDRDRKECTLSIHMQNDSVKGKGYGTQAEKLAIKYAFEKLGMLAVNADAVLKNTRSQHVLEKVGFRFVKEEGIFRYYRVEQAESRSSKPICSVWPPFFACHCSLVIRMALGLEPWKGPTMPFSSISSTIRAARA